MQPAFPLNCVKGALVSQLIFRHSKFGLGTVILQPCFSLVRRLMSVSTLGLMFVFRPKLFDALRGYDRATFLSDLAVGVTVGVVALPLAIGFAIASGVEPSRGL